MATGAMLKNVEVAMKTRLIRFAGQDWIAREGTGGPGNGTWSNEPQSVWVDDNGHLHMRLRYSGGVWWQTGIRSVAAARQGRHVFRIIGSVDRLPSQVMLGLFLYRDDEHELDIEARGGLLSYSVQPYDLPGHCQTVDLLLQGDHTTHVIEWHREHVLFQSFHGHGAQSQAKRISSFHNEDSPKGPLNVHMNLWVYAGSPGHEIEVTVSHYAVE